MYQPADIFDLAQTEHASIFDGCKFTWDVLAKIKGYVAARTKSPQRRQSFGHAIIDENVIIGEGTVIDDGVMIKGPAIIGRNCQIRHNAYIREDVIVGDNCMVGNACELKNVILFNNAVVPHFNYVGDSVLGHKAHLGAGVKVSNYKLYGDNVTIEMDGKPFDTGLRKFGALLGDGCEIGCNAVLGPGSIVGRHAVIYPNVFWRGILPANTIVKNRAAQDVVVLRPRGVL